MTKTSTSRWQALDLLRGLSIIGMLLHLTPAAWDQEYSWMEHARWEGGHLIDMVAPVFLFCIGAALPFSLEGRYSLGASRFKLAQHILWRAIALVVIGLVLNAYPRFDLDHLRIPGVLQRIGIAFGAVSLFILFSARKKSAGRLVLTPNLIAFTAVFVLISYWVLLYFVPVPGFGAPRFDPVGSWPAFIDRAVFSVPHMFIYWPVDGKVVFDPDGLLNIYPTCANILFGVIAGILYRDGLKRPILIAAGTGASLMAMALLLNGICPIVKNIWTSTFVLFSTGFALTMLALFMWITDVWKRDALVFPLQVFGANPMLAYLICFLFAPVLGLNWIPNKEFGKVSLGQASQIAAKGIVDLQLASFLFGLAYLLVLYLVLRVCYRRRWFLRL